MALPSALFKNWLWFWVWTSIALLIAIWELVSYLVFKKTISQWFWKWKNDHPKVKWIALGGYILFFGYLAAHLWFRW